MPSTDYDIITVGGGLGGAALAKVMADHGARVLVLERETQFKDRVRGEAMMPWGVAEAQALGIYEGILSGGGHELPMWETYLGQTMISRRELPATTPHGTPVLSFYHPTMQEVLIEAAAQAGAEVRRGGKVSGVRPGLPASVVLAGANGAGEELSARLVVGVDGRGSTVRTWAGFEVQRDPGNLLISGLLIDHTQQPDDTSRVVFNVEAGTGALIFPQGGGRARVYFALSASEGVRFQGAGDVARFIEAAVACGMPAGVFENVEAGGPLATFDGADTWVDHPYKDGVALVGGAAATSDPTWGQGLSLTARDVRVLTNELQASDDWDAACHAYAAEHDRYYGVVHGVSNWMSELFYSVGPEAVARRMKALALIAQDPTRLPDVNISGPDMEVDGSTRRRMLGEE